MESEKFDRLIKEKLQNMNPPSVEASEVNQILSRIPGNASVATGVISTSLKVWLGVLSITIISLGIIIYKQQQNIRNLEHITQKASTRPQLKQPIQLPNNETNNKRQVEKVSPIKQKPILNKLDAMFSRNYSSKTNITKQKRQHDFSANDKPTDAPISSQAYTFVELPSHRIQIKDITGVSEINPDHILIPETRKKDPETIKKNRAINLYAFASMSGQRRQSNYTVGITGIYKNIFTEGAIGYRISRGNRFMDEHEYIKKTGRDFHHDYRNRSIDTLPKRDINIGARSFTLPLAVGYRMKAGKNSYLMIAGGYNFVLNTTEHISYITSIQGQENTYSFVQQLPIKGRSNAFTYLGYNFEKNKISFQVICQLNFMRVVRFDPLTHKTVETTDPVPGVMLRAGYKIL